MSSESDASVSASGLSFAYLRIFRDGSDRVRPNFHVFSNGRQACHIRVAFVAVRGGVPISLTTAEIFAGFKLVAHTGGDRLGTGRYAAWGVQKIPTLYTWNEALVQEFAAALPAGAPQAAQLQPEQTLENTQVVDFYVTTRVAESLRVAVAFFDPDGILVASTNWELADVPEGSGYGDENGKFNSSVNIIGTRFAQPPIEAYGRKWSTDLHRLLDVRVLGSSDSLRTYEQYITLTYRGFTFDWLSATDRGSPAFSLWNDVGEAPSGAEWCVTYVIQPGQTTYGYSDSWIGHLKEGANNHLPKWNIWTLMDQYAKRRVPDRSVVTIGMILSNDHWQIFDWNHERVAENRSRNLVLMDIFGNEHAIRLFLIGGNGFNYVAIDTYSAVAAAGSDDFSVDSLGIDLQHRRLFANGRQQVRVGVSVTPRLGGSDTSLTEEEWASVRFLDHDTRQELPFTETEWTGGQVGWAAQRKYSGFDYFPGSFAAAPAAGTNTRYFYLSVDGAARGEPVRIAFSIKGRNGWIYASSGHVMDAQGSERYDVSYDVRVDIDVTQEEPLRYGGSDIQLAWRDLPVTGDGVHEAVFDRVGMVSFQPRAGAGPSVRRMICSPAGAMHWQTLMPGDTNPCAMGFAQPGSREIHCDPGIAAVMAFPALLDRADAFRGVLVLCGRTGVPLSGHEGLPRDRMAVWLLDGYGSEHELTVQFVNRSRDQIEFV